MAAERGVLSLGVLEVLEGGLVSVLVTVVENGASSKDVRRVHKVVPTFVKHMEEADDVPGVNLAQTLVLASQSAISLRGVKLFSVLHTAPWCRTTEFEVASYLGQPLSHIQCIT